jgi:hypothetical protein
MTSRTVFKVVSSFGPGGTLVALAEKLCKRFFPVAYELGDEQEFKSEEEDQIKNTRQEYVNTLFNFKGPFIRKSTSLNSVVAEQSWNELKEIIRKYKALLIKLEKQKLTRERIFYRNEENQVKYE